MKLFKSKSPDPAPTTAKQDNTTSSKGLSFFKRRREEQPNESSSYIAMEDGSKALSPGSSAKSVELSKMNPFKSSPKNMDDNASTSNRSLKSELLKASPKNDDKSIRSIKSSEKSVRSIQSVPEEEQEPLTKSTFVCLLGWCAIPCAAYILLFTQMGYGEFFYYSLSTSFGTYATYLGGSLLISSFLYYILDIDEWDSRLGRICCFIISTLLFLGFMLWVLLVSNEIPYGIIAMFAILNPLWLLMVKNVFYRKVDTRTFVGWLSGPLLLITIFTAVAFVVWVIVSPENRWNDVTRVQAAQHTGCAADFEEYPSCSSGNATEVVADDVNGNSTANGEEACFYVQDEELVFPEGCDSDCLAVYSGCSNGLILWAGPILMCLSMAFLSFFCKILRAESPSDQDIYNFGKIWLFALCIMWVAASLAGTAVGVTSSLGALTMASLIASTIILSASFSKDERKSNKKSVMDRIHEKYGDSLDIARGLIVVTCSPFIIIYLILSMINQMVRRVGINPCSQPASTADDSDRNASFFTVRTNKHLTRMRSWDRVKVLTFAVYWGVAYLILQVFVSKLTVVFLSWMIEATSDFNLAAVTLIVCGVGVIMFLLPPVPGVPVYLTLGIVLTARGYDTMGWFNAVLFSTAVGTGLKLFSSALQQKLIGENLSHYVKIRQFVGINSQMMRAMRLVLGKSGINVPKVAILIGGPDWPTSVLCGIMRLSLIQIMIGTLPIIILIFPTCLMGALVYMASLDSETGNPEIPWAGTAATIVASFTAAVQFGSMLVAAYYLEQAGEHRKDEVDAIEIDQEVKEADERDEHKKKCYTTVTQWRSVPMLPKALLVTAVVCITASCYLVQFFSSLCFVEHELTDTMENLEGNVLNLFLPLGWVAVTLFFASMCFLSIFTRWGNSKANELANSGNGPMLSKSQLA